MDVEVEGGQTLELPDGSSDQDIHDAVNHFTQTLAPAPSPTSQLGTQLGLTGRYIAEGLMGIPATLADVPALGYNAAADATQGQGKGYRFPEQNQAVSQGLTALGFPTPQGTQQRLVADIAKPMIGAMSGVGLGNALQSAASPVVQGVGQTLVANPGSQMMAGAVGGGASGVTREAGGSPAAQMAASIIAPTATTFARNMLPSASEDARALIQQGVYPTIGQTIGGSAKSWEEKATGVPILGDVIENAQGRAINQFNKAGYNDALAPIGETFGGDVGQEGLKAIRKAIGSVYDKNTPNLQIQPSQQLEDTLNTFRDKLTSPQQRAEFDAALDNNLRSNDAYRQGQAVTGMPLKGALSDLKSFYSNYKSSSSAGERAVGNAVQNAYKAVMDNATALSPETAQNIQNANQAYARYKILQDAGQRLGTHEGVFTPATLRSAVRSSDNTAGNRAFSEGDALMQNLSDPAYNVLAHKYPDSGTAGRSMLALLIGHAAASGVGHTVATLMHPSVSIPLAAGGYMYSQPGQAAIAQMLASPRVPLSQFYQNTFALPYVSQQGN